MNAETKPQFRSPTEYKPGDVIVTEEQILARIRELAPKMAARYKGKRLLVVGIMTGAMMLGPELAKELHRAGIDDMQYTYMKTEGYGNDTEAQQPPRIIQDMLISPAGREVLIVDDVADTRRTLTLVGELTKSRGALSVNFFTLFDKPDRKIDGIEPTWVGFTVPDIWLQGHGMGTGEIGRTNPNVIKGPWPPEAANPNKG